MVKKTAKKRKVIKKKKSRAKATKKTKRKSKPRITQSASEVQVEKILVENFVSLQKVMTNLSVKFDSLTNQISKLLDLFEISAKSLAQKEFDLGKKGGDDKKIVEKIDNLFEQNKVIARGLTLLHEKEPLLPPPKRPFGLGPRKNPNKQGYEKSISSDDSLESELERNLPEPE